MVYSSTLVGPDGPHYVPLAPGQAFRAFLAMRFVAHGSDQRADWIGNLLMLVPFGFLTAAAVWGRRARPARMLLSALACLAVILVIKYLQLFFPPRTVTLNYVTAQAIGAALGCAGFAVWHDRIGRAARFGGPVTCLRIALALYTLALAAFILMPLDFALSPGDIRMQLERLPGTLLAVPGSGRPAIARTAELIAASLAFVPVGVMLALRPGRGVLVRGLAVTTGLYALSTLVMGAYPALLSIACRTGGILLGAAALRWLVRQDIVRLRARLRALVPWLVPPYLLTVVLVAGLASARWLNPEQAAAQADRLGLLPLFDYYIVTKAEAAKDIAAHALMYAPVGVALWLLGPARRTAAHAFLLAAALSFLVELGRYFRPGTGGDINSVAVAGFAAMLAARAMPTAWSLLAGLAAGAPCRRRYRDPAKGRAAAWQRGPSGP
jgi:VanZ family protein